jgi:hypothetical protein
MAKTKITLPIGLKPPPRRAPKKLRTTEDLRQLQRLMTHALARPLTDDDNLQEKWIDGRPMAELAAEFIKPNDRLTAFDRLQIYARCYWFRLIDGVYDDNPALRAFLGEEKFSAMSRAYVARYPSRSFTLRNFCARLPQFLREEPRLTAPHTALAEQLARFEWAQTVAFDGEARPVLTPAEISATPPARLRLGVQPYVSLLALNYALDDYVIAVKKREALRGDASNTPDGAPRPMRRARKVSAPRRERIWLVVHRVDLLLYYKRLEPEAFKILQALQAGRTLTQAIAAAGKKVKPEQVQGWFKTWMELGWFCRR